MVMLPSSAYASFLSNSKGLRERLSTNIILTLFTISFYVYGCSASMYMHHMCAWGPQRPEEIVRFPGPVATDNCEP